MSDPLATSAAYADDETVDTDFVHRLVRGADLLQAGDADQSRVMLERALRLRPDNERGQNLLALSYFKLGQLDQAERIYRTLSAAHPEDAALRVNLGLVLLKKGREDDAIALFETALELAPDHRKAQNYIGLAHMQKQAFATARKWFDLSGNTQMSERMAAALAGDAVVREAERRGSGGSEGVLSAAEATPIAPSGHWMATLSPSPSPETTLDAAPPELASFTLARRFDKPLAEGARAFTATETMVTVAVKGELFTRVDGLLASFGDIDFKPEFKRFRGRVTDKPFGEAARRVMRVTGVGQLWIALNGLHYQTVEIGDEAAYFREDALFGFEESLLFENGRVPSRHSNDLQLVHLRGRGLALIVSKQRPRAIEIRKNEPCRLPLEVLLGWHGNVAPRIVALGSGEASADALYAVELSGEGYALLDASF